MLEIPIRTDLEAYSQIVTLDGVQFRMDFLHTTREDSWYFDLYAIDDTPLVRGAKLVPGYLPLEQFGHITGIPAGQIEYTELGLVYHEESELG